MINKVKSALNTILKVDSNQPSNRSDLYQIQSDVEIAKEVHLLINNRYNNIQNTLLEVIQKIQNTSISIPYQIEKNDKIVNDKITTDIESILNNPSIRQQTFEMLINDIVLELLLNGVFYILYDKDKNDLKCLKSFEVQISQTLQENSNIPYIYKISQGSYVTETFTLIEDFNGCYYVNNNDSKILFASEIEFEDQYNNIVMQNLSKSPLLKVANFVISQKKIIEKNFFLSTNKKESEVLLVSGKNLISGEKKQEISQAIENKVYNSSKTGTPGVVVLGGEDVKMDLKQLNNGIFQSQFMDLYDACAKHIYQVFGLPIEKGLEQAKYSNANNASIEYLEQAVKPKLNFIYSNLSNLFAIIFNFNKKDYKIKPNYTEHIIVKQYALQSAKNLEGIATINERRQIVGLEPIVGGDVLNAQDFLNENNF